jgi:choice-of-anchor C domain-containing protein
MHPPRTRSVILSVALALALASGARANLIGNGSFETGPTLPAHGSMLLAAGETGLTSWTISGVNMEYANDAVWVPADGTRSLALSGTGTGTLSQAFATVPGTLYTVTFALSGEAHTPPEIKTVRVAAAGQQQDFAFDSAANWEWDMQWVTKTWSFTANAATTTLSFTTVETGDGGSVIDKVDVSTNVGIGDDRPVRLALAPVTPNPAAGAATIAFVLPSATDVQLVVRDLQGRVVTELVNGPRPAGVHRVQWESGAGLPSGLYFVSLTAQGRTLVRRVSLVRGR